MKSEIEQFSESLCLQFLKAGGTNSETNPTRQNGVQGPTFVLEFLIFIQPISYESFSKKSDVQFTYAEAKTTRPNRNQEKNMQSNKFAVFEVQQ